jgi:hypothetical protein
MGEIGKVLFGAVVGFVAALIAERWKRIHTTRTAAMMIIRELEFHRHRLNMAVMLDQHEQAEYLLQFPSPVWTAQGSALVAGASARKAEAVLSWYASMAVLGYALSRRVGLEGPSITGPDRARLHAALSDAHSAAQRLAMNWSLRKGRRFSPSLFDEISAH